MKIYTLCNTCHQKISIRTAASTRPDLQMDKGSDELELKCIKCGNINKKHINEIKAEPGKVIMIIGIIIGLIATVVLWNFYGAIGTAGLAIPMIFWRQQMADTNAFNSYMIKR